MTRTPEPTEVRRFEAELRSADRSTVVLRVATYDHEYDLGSFTESLREGVFRKSVAESARSMPLMSLHDHDQVPIGKAVNWIEQDGGLFGEFRMDTRPAVDEMWRLIDEDLMRGASVGFMPIRTNWDDSRPRPHAERIEARLLEVSLVPVPAYSDAGVVATRSAGHPEMQGLQIVPTPRLDEAKAWLASLKR